MATEDSAAKRTLSMVHLAGEILTRSVAYRLAANRIHMKFNATCITCVLSAVIAYMLAHYTTGDTSIFFGILSWATFVILFASDAKVDEYRLRCASNDLCALYREAEKMVEIASVCTDPETVLHEEKNLNKRMNNIINCMQFSVGRRIWRRAESKSATQIVSRNLSPIGAVSDRHCYNRLGILETFRLVMYAIEENSIK